MTTSARAPPDRRTIFTEVPTNDHALHLEEAVRTGSDEAPRRPVQARPRLGELEDRTVPTSPGVIAGTLLAAQNFDTDGATTGSFHIPPDAHGAAGSDHLVSVVNSSINVLNKFTGGLLVNTSLNSFFAANGPVTSLFDPKVIYDQYFGRFVVVALERGGHNDGNPANDVSRIHVAVSSTQNAAGTWFLHAINANTVIGGANTWADYPGLAVGLNQVYVTANQFRFDNLTFTDSRLWIIDKFPFYSGSPATFAVYDADPASVTPTLQPAHTYGEVGPVDVGTYLVASDFQDGAGNDALRVIHVDGPALAPAITQFFVPLGGNIYDPLAGLPDAPQPGTAIRIETNDTRMLSAVWCNSSLWAVNTINPLTGPDAGEATAHFYEIDTTIAAPVLVQHGNAGGDDIHPNAHTYYPSIAVDRFENVAIGFALSSPNHFAGSYYTVSDRPTRPAPWTPPPCCARAGCLRPHLRLRSQPLGRLLGHVDRPSRRVYLLGV